MATTQDILEKVKRLLALSQSANVNEASAAAAAANRLIDKHRIDTADLSYGQAPVQSDSEYLYESGKVTRWKVSLASLLAKHYGCYLWNVPIRSNTGRQVSRFQLIGQRSDIDLVRYMFAWLTNECTRLIASHAYGQGRNYCNSYGYGFVAGIESQLNASRVSVASEATSTALVALNARGEQAAQWARSQCHNIRTVKGTTFSCNSRAYNTGRETGQALHLGQRVGSGNTRLLT